MENQDDNLMVCNTFHAYNRINEELDKNVAISIERARTTIINK